MPNLGTPRTIVTLTIPSLPANIDSERLLADALVTVDFQALAEEMIVKAVINKRRRSTLRYDAIVVRAINVRAQDCAYMDAGDVT